MSWNHRVVRRFYPNTHMDDSMLYEIHEVYYNEDGTMKAKTVAILNNLTGSTQKATEKTSEVTNTIEPMDTEVLSEEQNEAPVKGNPFKSAPIPTEQLEQCYLE